MYFHSSSFFCQFDLTEMSLGAGEPMAKLIKWKQGRDSGLISPRVILYPVSHGGKWRLERERKQEGRGKGGRGKRWRERKPGGWRRESGTNIAQSHHRPSSWQNLEPLKQCFGNSASRFFSYFHQVNRNKRGGILSIKA